MAKAKVASLGSGGWIEDTAGKADTLFSYFCVSESTQSLVYEGRITSLTDILQQHSADLVALCTAMRDKLNAYYAPYFDAVNITIDIDDVTAIPNATKDSVSINVTGTVTDDGVVYSLAYLAMVNNGKLSKFIKLNEGQTT